MRKNYNNNNDNDKIKIRKLKKRIWIFNSKVASFYSNYKEKAVFPKDENTKVTYHWLTEDLPLMPYKRNDKKRSINKGINKEE